MKKLGKILGWLLLVIIVLIPVAITFTIGWRPFIGPRMRETTSRKFDATPERLARGKYLAEDVTGCMECHTPHDWSGTGTPTSARPNRGAGEVIPLKDLPGLVVAPNLTPDSETGAGTWTDDQLARAIREGIGHDGRTLFNMMPYEHFRSMSDEDLASVIVYLRALPPVRNVLPKTEIIFPVKYLIRSVPEPVTDPVPSPDVSTAEKRGTYLTTMSGCSDCHTPVDAHHAPLPGMDFSGGQILEGAFGRVASANLTPDPSGIPYYDTKMFIDTIRTGKARARLLNPVMPVAVYSGMTDEDLSSIFAYLKTVKPVHHRVDNTEPAALCKRCNNIHGGAETAEK
jgi:mono/diheme cytochrome c family protein